MKTRKELKQIIDDYIADIVCGTGWQIDGYKLKMMIEIEKIMDYKKGE